MLDNKTQISPFAAPPKDDAWRASARDNLHGIATFYLRHGEPARALTLLLTALHLTRATKPLLLATALAFLQVGQHEQAIAALERAERDFGACRSLLILRARTVMKLNGMEAGQAVMREALALADDHAEQIAFGATPYDSPGRAA